MIAIMYKTSLGSYSFAASLISRNKLYLSMVEPPGTKWHRTRMHLWDNNFSVCVKHLLSSSGDTACLSWPFSRD